MLPSHNIPQASPTPWEGRNSLPEVQAGRRSGDGSKEERWPLRLPPILEFYELLDLSPIPSAQPNSCQDGCVSNSKERKKNVTRQQSNARRTPGGPKLSNTSLHVSQAWRSECRRDRETQSPGFPSGLPLGFFFPISPDKTHVFTLDTFFHTTSFINRNILCLQCWGAEKFQPSISFLSFSSQKIRK